MPNAASESLAKMANLFFDLEMDVPLDRIETGHMNQHGGMFAFLAAQLPNGTCEQKRVDRFYKGRRWCILAIEKRDVPILVFLGHPSAEPLFRRVVVDFPYQIDAAIPSFLVVLSKNSRRTYVIGRGGQVDDEC